MKVRGRKRAIHLTAITALTMSGLVITMAPSVVEAASFITVPTRLYMAPAGASIPNTIAQFVGIPKGTLEFDGETDLISQDVRSIVVNTADGTNDCDLTEPPYDIDDCSRIQIGPIDHGRLWAGVIETIPDGDGVGGNNGVEDDVYLLPSGARIEGEYQVAKGSYYLAINGTPVQLNDALADLVYTPNLGYYYEGSNGENVNIAVSPGDNSAIVYATIEIRVLNVNGFPVVTGPGNKQAQADVELLMPAITPPIDPPFTGTQFTVIDTDNDENVDGQEANPEVPESALIDGPGTSMLLVGYLDCAVPDTNPNYGFHFRGGGLVGGNNDIRTLVRNFFQYTQLPPSGQTIVTALLDGIDAIEPGLTTRDLASSNPSVYTNLFAGVGTMADVQYALSQLAFRHDEPGDTCTMWTMVSDLGNNGLPLQYFGDPPTGIEVPMIGLGLDSFNINTGNLTEIDISFQDASTLYVSEALAPLEVEAQLVISPDTHPGFTIQWEVNPKNGDPEVVGIATADDDFQGTYNNTLTVPAGETLIPFPPDPDLDDLPDPPGTTVRPDTNGAEGNESFTFDLVLNQEPPDGYFISSSVPSKTVVIIDDDDGPKSVSVSDAAVVEGDSGTRVMTFTLNMSGPADGNESVTVATADSSATIANNDYMALPPTVVSFATGESQKTVSVTVNGDLADETGATDEVLILNLASPSNVTISDAEGVGTIENDDQARTVSIADASKVEGISGTSQLIFTLSLSSPAKGNETVAATSTNGTAVAADPENDYEVLVAPAVAFVAGATTATVSVTINGDVAPEGNDTFTLTLGPAVNLLIGDGTATGTIQNDDGVPTVSIGDVTVVEGNAGTTSAIFDISLSAPAAQAASITVASINGSAGAPTDFTSVGPLVVPFAVDQMTATVTVVVNGDLAVEVNEAFTMTLSNPNQLVILDGTATGTITNDDVTQSVVSIANNTVTEAAAIDNVVISMTNPVGRTCVVTVTTATGTAGSGDFTAISGTTFSLVGVASDTRSLTIANDALVEPNETFTVTIALHASSNPACVLDPAQSTATITIVSDDLASVVSIVDATVTEAAAADQTIISMTNPAGHNCSVSVTTSNGTAVAPGDYSPLSAATFNLLAVPSDVLSLTIVDDSDVDPGQTFAVNIALLPASNPACVLGDASATILIVDNDSPADATPPSVTINQAVGQADPTSSSPILFTATFSEPVVGFSTIADVVLSGTSNGAKVATISGGPTVFTVSVAVTGATNAGTVVATIPAAAASDGTNASIASTSDDNSVVFDQVAPTVTINQGPGQTDPTTATPIVFAVEFSEPVTGFATGDAVLSGTAGATAADVTGSGASYLVTLTGMAVSGTVIISVAAGVAQDAATNPNVAATVIDNTVQFNVSAVPLSLTISVPGNIVRNNDPGQPGAIVAYPAVTSTGGVPPVTVACDVPSGAFFVLGTTTVSCMATDAELQGTAVVSASFTVQVLDVEPPVIADPPDLTRVVPGLGSIAVAFPTPSAIDNSGLPPTVVCSLASGSSFSIGVATVTCTATDGSGNQASTTFTVTVTTDGLGLGLPATGATPQPMLAMALFLIGVGLLLVGYRRNRSRFSTE